MEAEQEVVLTSLGEELDTACRSLARNGEDKLQVSLTYLSFLCVQNFSIFFGNNATFTLQATLSSSNTLLIW